MKAPRFMLTAPASGSGKTMITCGILRALKKRGLNPVSFKCGPDYIDPMFHTKVLHTPSRNLDTFFTDPQMTRYLFSRWAQEGDLSVMEGVMGYYDGLGGTSTQASTYDLACVTETPVILIVNCKSMSLSALALIKGFITYRENSRIQGIILNQVSEGLYQRLAKSIEEDLGVRVFGYVPKVRDMSLESRHLGLVLPGEVADIEEKLDSLAELLEKTLDLDGILELAEEADGVQAEMPSQLCELFSQQEVREIKRYRPLVAVARDEAFCFIYEDNLRLLEDMGARLSYFSPLHDAVLPEGSDGLLLYGGYPELYAEGLENNRSMRGSIRSALQKGMPCMAECGGFMYLHDSMEDMEGRTFQGAGIIPGRAFYTGRLCRFGYISLETEDSQVLGSQLKGIRGHEFHYFDSTSCGDSCTARKPIGSRSWPCMHGKKNALMGFPHLYYQSQPRLAADFLMGCAEYGVQSEAKENTGGKRE